MMKENTREFWRQSDNTNEWKWTNMNFCLVITNLAGGGAERATLDLAQALLAAEHHVDLILLENFKTYDVPTNVKIHLLQENQTRYGHGWFAKRFLVARFKNLWKKLNQKTPFDLTISRLPFCNEIVSISRVSSVVYLIDNALSQEISNLQKKHGRLKAYRRLMRYKSIYENKNLVAVSKGVQKDLCDILNTNSGLVSLIYNPINIDFIRVKAIANDVVLPDFSYVVHVARFNSQKRHDLLLDAWKEIKSSHKLVLLTDPCPELLKLISDRGLEDHIYIAGFQMNPYQWIANAELLVLCSDFEGFALVLVEAAICRTPFISTDCKYGPSEIAINYPEALVPCGNARALSTAIANKFAKEKRSYDIDLSPYTFSAIASEYEKLATALKLK